MREKFAAKAGRKRCRLAPMNKPQDPLPLVWILALLGLLALAFYAGRWWGMQGG